LLGGEVSGQVETSVSHGDVHGSSDGGEEHLVGEVSGDMGTDSGGSKGHGVVGSTKGDGDVGEVSWGGGGCYDVAQFKSVSFVVWDFQVSGESEDDWDNNVGHGGDSFLGDRDTETVVGVVGVARAAIAERAIVLIIFL